ncbi:hypothetical protein ASD8599_03156 [Ascidiaceihabitans donghaensis]|uniref:Uncharacterized protein n=1 Tax=Ascidiaceihabitans donghaensis TaxID=1510460 RepID=A0A2R8BH78_9RHOB|nr:hypothetical protein ASD8599_03156 [Ascidiaceihabitans donghaensis]
MGVVNWPKSKIPLKPLGTTAMIDPAALIYTAYDLGDHCNVFLYK